MNHLEDITAEDAVVHARLAHASDTGKLKKLTVEESKEFLINEIKKIGERLRKERLLDGNDPEMKKKLLDGFKNKAEYIRWLEGVYAFQIAYLSVLN